MKVIEEDKEEEEAIMFVKKNGCDLLVFVNGG